MSSFGHFRHDIEQLRRMPVLQLVYSYLTAKLADISTCLIQPKETVMSRANTRTWSSVAALCIFNDQEIFN